jgi:ankyrin repeat protein
MKRTHTFLLSLALGTTLMAAPRATRAGQPADRALITAIQNGDRAGVRAALAQGANPDSRDTEGSPALVEAALYGDAAMLRCLLERGANPNAANQDGQTALHIAAGDAGKAALLIAHGANVNARTKLGRTPLMAAVRQDGAYPAVKLLIDHGADPKVLDPAPLFGAGSKASLLLLAAKTSDVRTARLLVERGVDVNAKTDIGDTPLMEAAWSGNVETARYLISAGADVKASMTESFFKGFTALTLAAVADNPEIAGMLIAAGADVNARDGLGYTPLVWASMTESGDARIVRSLIAAGAEVNVKGAFDETPLTYAAKRGATPIVDVLRRSGAQGVIAAGPAVAPAVANIAFEARDIRSAVERGMAPLLKSSTSFLKVSGCFSCHNQTLPVEAASLARSRGMHVDRALEDKALKSILGVTKPMRAIAAEMGDPGPDIQVVGGYVLNALAAENHPADKLTASIVHNMAARQLADGRWPGFAPRPPIENGDIQATVYAMRALQLYGMPGRKAEFAKRIARAREWLLHATPRTTEECAMMLWGLTWSNAAKADIARAVKALLDEQRPDGGWAQLPTLDSDAYATGKALAALHDSGLVQSTDATYRRGVAYLLRTQLADGTWRVKSRVYPFQPLKPSGFPHDRDQWISAAGTSWASIALSYAVEPQMQHAAVR